jgi:hypothetical protein
MDAKPKSNKIKRLEKKHRLELKAQRRASEQARAAAAARVLEAERMLALYRDREGLLERLMRGESVRVPLMDELCAVAGLFAGANAPGAGNEPMRPDYAGLRRLVRVCLDRADFLAGRDALRFGQALLALSAHSGRWVRPPEDWKSRSHNVYRQFHALVRHLTARYDVPTFMDTAWLEGLTRDGVVHQRWFLHVAQGQNLRTAEALAVPLTKRQAHLYLQAPDDFDVLGAFRWAQILDLGGDERLVRSVLGTRAATSFGQDDFWVTVFRWLVAHPMLDPAHHGPVIDYLHHQRYVPSVPNRKANQPGEPLLLAPQPNLSMKARAPEALIRSVAEWHRRLGRQKAPKFTTWPPSGIAPLRLEEGQQETRKVYTVTELLSSRELIEEGASMGHCVGSYADSCASGRVSIWSMRVADAWGNESRLLTLEVWNANRHVIQARRKFNKLPTPKDLAVLRRWADTGGPSLSKWVAT